MDNGSILEMGSYKELIARKTFLFYHLDKKIDDDDSESDKIKDPEPKIREQREIISQDEDEEFDQIVKNGKLIKEEKMRKGKVKIDYKNSINFS